MSVLDLDKCESQIKKGETLIGSMMIEVLNVVINYVK